MKDNNLDALAWPDVPIRSVTLISDKEKRKEYIKKIKLCYSRVINVLVGEIKNRNFNFSLSDEELTCRIMVREIMQELYKQNYTKQNMLDKVMGNNKTK